MAKRITATAAKNNFGGLLEDVATLGRVEIIRHRRVVAIVLSPRALARETAASDVAASRWGKTHMVLPKLACTARIVRAPADIDDGAIALHRRRWPQIQADLVRRREAMRRCAAQRSSRRRTCP